MNTLPSTSFSQQIVFDGTADGLSFDEFVQRFEKARQEGSNLATLSTSNEIEDVVPSHLYGDALRYYETLDPDCQRDWSQLRSVMTREFPGALRKETIIPRFTMPRDSLRTVVQAPPITSSMLAGPERAIAIPEEKHSGSAEGEGDKRERASVSRFLLTEKFRALLSSPTPIETDPNSAQHITAHSMFIQFAWWDPPSNVIQVKVDLSNRESVAACKEGPLFTIPSSLNAARYQVGFTFTVHRGKQNTPPSPGPQKVKKWLLPMGWSVHVIANMSVVRSLSYYGLPIPAGPQLDSKTASSREVHYQELYQINRAGNVPGRRGGCRRDNVDPPSCLTRTTRAVTR